MKKYILFILIMTASFFNARAQNGWLPPVNFPSGTQLCDNTSWQLVFYDDFDGNQLSNQWNKYLTWDNMPIENSNWSGARAFGDNVLLKDSNVIVSNGVCKLILKNEPWSWKCDTCAPALSRTRNLTAGTICTPFYLNGQSNYYNSGKFEAKIKFPVGLGTKGSFWLSYGSSVNEIDIAEAYGFQSSSLPQTTYNLHAWGPDPQNNEPNPYNLPEDAWIGNTYPNQNWWNFLYNDFFNQADWHTYTCYWDTAKIDFYTDDSYTNTIWKYYQYRYQPSPRRHSVNDPVYRYKVYPTCNPASGQWNITYGYPYNDQSQSHIRFNINTMNGYTGDPNAGTHILDSMEIDYVKVWQRHPEADGHESLCHTVNAPVLSGPIQLCTNGTYVATPAVSGGYWTTTSGAAITNTGIYGNGNAFAEVSRVSNTWNQASGYVRYHYPTGPEGCPTGYVAKIFDCFTLPGHQLMAVHTLIGNEAQFQLFAPANELMPTSEPTFEWNLTYIAGEEVDTQHYHAFGRFISTPVYEQDLQHQNYYMHWQVTATEPGGQSITHSGTRTAQSGYGRQAEDTDVYYLDAQITDIDTFEQNVYNAVSNTFMPPDADSNAVVQMIEKVRAKMLAPYIIPANGTQNRPGGNQNNLAVARINTIGGEEQQSRDTRLYPNPISTALNILPGHGFKANSEIVLRVYDIVGTLLKTEKKRYFPNETLTFSLAMLHPGVYFVSLKQKGHVEHYQIVKN